MENGAIWYSLYFLRSGGYIIHILIQKGPIKNKKVRPFLDNRNKKKTTLEGDWTPQHLSNSKQTNHLPSRQQQKDFHCFKKRQSTSATALWQAAVPLFALLSSCSSKTAAPAARTPWAPLFTSLQSFPVVVN